MRGWIGYLVIGVIAYQNQKSVKRTLQVLFNLYYNKPHYFSAVCNIWHIKPVSSVFQVLDKSPIYFLVELNKYIICVLPDKQHDYSFQIGWKLYRPFGIYLKESSSQTSHTFFFTPDLISIISRITQGQTMHSIECTWLVHSVFNMEM